MNKEGMEKNYEVVSRELHSYWLVLQSTWDRLKTTDRKFHVAAGILPDTFRTLPRTLSYTVYLLLIVAAYIAVRSIV